MNELTFNCTLAYTDDYRKCYIKNAEEDIFVEVQPLEKFELFGFTVFMRQTKYFKLSFTDHITGGLIGIFDSKEQFIEEFTTKIGQQKFIEILKLQIKENGYSPAYKLEIL